MLLDLSRSWDLMRTSAGCPTYERSFSSPVTAEERSIGDRTRLKMRFMGV
jgi:hypothetical protein